MEAFLMLIKSLYISSKHRHCHINPTHTHLHMDLKLIATRWKYCDLERGTPKLNKEKNFFHMRMMVFLKSTFLRENAKMAQFAVARTRTQDLQHVSRARCLKTNEEITLL